MDEKYIEMAEQNVAAATETQRLEVAKAALPTADRKPEHYQTTVCYDCGVPLPELRMQKGLYYCTPCQTERERLQKLGR